MISVASIRRDTVGHFFPSLVREDALKDIKRKLMVAGLTASSLGLLLNVLFESGGRN